MSKTPLPLPDLTSDTAPGWQPLVSTSPRPLPLEGLLLDVSAGIVIGEPCPQSAAERAASARRRRAIFGYMATGPGQLLVLRVRAKHSDQRG